MMSIMYRFLAATALQICIVLPAAAQYSVTVRVLDAHEEDALTGVNVVLEGTSIGSSTDADGLVTIAPIPGGAQTLVFSFIGYHTERLTWTFPGVDSSVQVVYLEEEDVELGQAIVTATRTSRTIADTPTRVETIGGEEIEEKIAMDPSGISMLLNESPGIVVQQTSAVSAGASFRIQGLDGRYTQLLRDGFPLYGGLGGGLSLLQIPPLDLLQVEIIKGPASTLYGGDAIAGLVNLVTKRPREDGERSILINATSAGGADVAGYAAQRGERLGYTVLGTVNVQRAYDAEGDAFTNLPRTRRATLSPTFYHYGPGVLTLGLSGTLETREGGDVAVIRKGADGYTEKNETMRLTALAGYEHPTSSASRLTLRTSGSYFDRTLDVPDFRFDGNQLSTYSEASFTMRRGRHDVVLGVDFRTERFDQSDNGETSLDYAYRSVAAFAQDTWDVTRVVAVESGIRVEDHNDYGRFLLPRLGLLVRPADRLAVRVGGGLGYKAPTPFLEEAEERAYQGVRPLDDIRAERSIGGNVDANYRAILGAVTLSFNQAAYLTRLENPLTTVADGPALSFITSTGFVEVWGSETTAKLSYGDVSLFVGYVFLDADRSHDGARMPLSLTARHRTYTVLVWEQHGRGRIGLEAYYTGPQDLPDGSAAPGYLISGVMAQWRFGQLSAFANLENVFDARQSRWTPLVIGPRHDPTFPPTWGPTDGFIANGGVKIDL